MPSMSLDKADKLVIDSEQVIAKFNDEELIKKDEEEAMTKRTQFAFGGENVRDRIKKRKMNAKIGNEVQKLEKIIRKKGAEKSDEESVEEDQSQKRIK